MKINRIQVKLFPPQETVAFMVGVRRLDLTGGGDWTEGQVPVVLCAVTF